MKASLNAVLGVVLICGTAYADPPANTQSTDYKLIGLQMASGSPDLVDEPANSYKFIKVFFTASTDLAALAHAQDRDVRVGAYRCDASTSRSVHDMYQTDPPVYDAYGQVTRDRQVKADSSLDKFKGIYYFLLPTWSRYAMGASYVFEAPYDLYSELQDMCFETPGSAATFFSNEVKIPSDSIKAVLVTPQGGHPRR